jgi:hypothetical protein
VRYVSKTGTSTPPYTSWQTAADSIQKCINICIDGDTIYVANGIYKENLVINTAISLIGSSMDSTVIDGTGMGQFTLRLNNNGYVSNIKVLGKGREFLQTATIIAFNYAEIKNCRVSSAAVGVAMYNNSDYSSVYNVYFTDALYGYQGDGIFPNSINNINNCIFVFANNDAVGIALSVDGNYEIKNNIIISTNSNSFYSGISVDAPKSVFINNNLISGFKNNINFQIHIDSALIKNNILINSNSDYSLWSMNDDPTIRNNVIKSNANGIYGWTVDSDYNLFWENIIDYNSSIYGDSDRVASPMFVNDTIPTLNGPYDFHLQAFSPGIDKGDPNILDLDGTRSDIGIYGGPFGETYTYQDLAPLAPRNLSAVVDSNYISVRWNRNTEADTSYYKVYRDTVINFTIDSTKLVSSSTDTFFVQANPRINTKFVYKVSCVDNQGNESLPSNELVVNITSVSTNDYPMTITDYVLYQNYPNPFNPCTKIGYQIKERAYVKLMVYDIKGELVSVLVNKEQNAGYYEAEISSSSIQHQESSIKGIASGIYLYRIEVIGNGKIPVYTEMKKMILIK